MALPALSGLEVLRRLAALRLQQPPLVLAAGRRRRRAAQGGRDPRHRQRIQAVPCPPGVLLRRIWQLVDRDVERRWSRLPPVQRTLVGTTRGLLGRAGSIVRDGGELEAGSARLAGIQVVEALSARLMGEVLTSLQAYHDYTFAHSFRVATHLATFALATGMRRTDAELLAQAGLLHDIGKTAIPVAILDKPGPLGQQRVAGGPAPPGGGGRRAWPQRQPARPSDPHRRCSITSGWTARAIPTASPARRSTSRACSAPSPTCTPP